MVLRALPLAALVAMALSTVAACDSCGKPETSPAVTDAADEASPAPAAAEESDPVGPYDGSAADLGKRFRDAAPRLEGGALGDAEAWVVDPACGPAASAPRADASAGATSFVSVLLDPRCAIGSARAKQLRADLEGDGGGAPLKQEAKLDPGPSAVAEGFRVEVRLVNAGRQPLILPLSHHSKLPAFTALAEDAHRAIFELEPPTLDGVTDTARPRFAALSLPPGGAAVATVNVTPKITRRIAPACPEEGRGAGEGGTCSPPKLPKGRYTLHVGQLVTDVEAGAPARIEIVVP
ncbi:MAG: hypothetical protein JST00_15885 [Deltaproteobacteria bacterium]|nr:hypothetical protein [Deltaproteobacteria bacterium]